MSRNSRTSCSAPLLDLPFTVVVIMEDDALQIAHDSPWKLTASTVSPSIFSVRTIWSPHSGLCPSALCVASGSTPQFRGFLL